LSDDTEYAPPPHHLGYWLERRRIKPTHLAGMVGVSHSTALRWLSGETSLGASRHIGDIARALDITVPELLFGPGKRPHALLPADIGFADDAAPFSGEIPGITLRLGATETPYRVETDALSRARGLARLQPGDIAIFDIGAEAMQAFESGQHPDGTAVIAQVHDDTRDDAATIIRQWVGDSPGLLVTNRPVENSVINL